MLSSIFCSLSTALIGTSEKSACGSRNCATIASFSSSSMLHVAYTSRPPGFTSLAAPARMELCFAFISAIACGDWCFFFFGLCFCVLCLLFGVLSCLCSFLLVLCFFLVSFSCV